MLAGVAINPHTPVMLLEDVIEDADLVLVMSVNPGFGGQKFIERSIAKIEKLRALIDSRNAETLIEVDGGVNLETAPRLVAAGADILVAGNSVFGADEPAEMIMNLKNAR